MKTKLVLFAVLFFLFYTDIKAQVNAGDSLALVDLYNTTNGSGWIRKNNWLAGPVSSWYGITVANSRVTKVDLSSNLLQGTLSSSLGNLSAVTLLYLYYNKLTGSLPASLGNLAQVSSLWLFGNQLSGAIPSSFNKLANLDTLYLQYNLLTSPVPALGQLKKLTQLNLSFNQFTGSVPLFIFNLPQLKNVSFAGNQLTQKGNVQIPGVKRHFVITLFANQFSFDGLESLVQKVDSAALMPQASLTVHQHGSSLAVYAGGTLANNTYTWRKSGSAQTKVITGDSTFTPASPGTYTVSVTNSIIGNRLTLQSNPFIFSTSTLSVIAVSPNPAVNSLQVSGLDKEVNTKITVNDMSGHTWLTVFSQKSATITMNLATLQPGTYWLKADYGKNIRTLQFIKQ